MRDESNDTEMIHVDDYVSTCIENLDEPIGSFSLESLFETPLSTPIRQYMWTYVSNDYQVNSNRTIETSLIDDHQKLIKEFAMSLLTQNWSTLYEAYKAYYESFDNDESESEHEDEEPNEPIIEPEVKEDSPECSVCFNATARTTKCGHPVCAQCAINMRAHRMKTCPCCRAHI